MDIRDYWMQPPQVQDKQFAASQPRPSYLRPKGCKCKVADAEQCAWNRHLPGSRGYGRVVCPCDCHTDTGGYASNTP